MVKSMICLCLTEKTMAEDLKLIETYRKFIDLVELRVDFLEEDERLNIREFPALAKIPCILTIRRTVDGGQFAEGEGSRTMLFARALAFADEDKSKNFAYVDFEEDFRIPSLQDAALAYGTKIIRSCHDMKNPIKNIKEKIKSMKISRFEIPKIAFMPHSLKDVTDLYKEMKDMKGTDQIVCAMGPFGLPTRILSDKFNSYLTYTSPAELNKLSEIGHIDPKTLDELYHFHGMNGSTKIYGITGWPLKVTSSPKIHNGKFAENRMNAVYIPFKSETAEDAFEFANEIGMKGFSVTIPHKEKIISHLFTVDKKVQEIGACNTVVNQKGMWTGFNTDCSGFEKALLEFTGLENLKKKKVAIIGAGGAAKAVAYAIKEMGAKACVFNRTLAKAKSMAEKYGFDYATLDENSVEKLTKYSDIIVQTTSKGMGATEEPNEDNDPIWFYEFTGKEMVYDIVYEPEVTPIMARAKKAGCKVNNGYTMLKYQGEEQFALYREVYMHE
ncbi:MAG: type I 3-dehydroquinate dehydratase [Treponema sp.]|nr:type I 3-dehydroquinate dehydratase [Candidatus Treponema equifaecale]